MASLPVTLSGFEGHFAVFTRLQDVD